MSDEAPEKNKLELAIEEAEARYRAAMNALQAGISTKNELVPRDTEPRVLRTGINSAMMQASALAHLLMEKGVITKLEWFSALADMAEYEVKIYEDEISQILGTKVTLK